MTRQTSGTENMSMSTSKIETGSKESGTKLSKPTEEVSDEGSNSIEEMGSEESRNDEVTKTLFNLLALMNILDHIFKHMPKTPQTSNMHTTMKNTVELSHANSTLPSMTDENSAELTMKNVMTQTRTMVLNVDSKSSVFNPNDYFLFNIVETENDKAVIHKCNVFFEHSSKFPLYFRSSNQFVIACSISQQLGESLVFKPKRVQLKQRGEQQQLKLRTRRPVAQRRDRHSQLERVQLYQQEDQVGCK